jgi:hypothetical protein
MADLNDTQAAQSVKIIGSDSTGVEQTPVQSTSNGGLHINLRNNSGTEIATTTNPAIVAGNVASAATDSGNPIKVGSVYNDTVPTFTTGQRVDLQSDTVGSLYINDENRKATYSASFTALVAAASATDIFTITGSGSKTVRILRMFITPTQTTAAYNIVNVVKRSTANTGGTSTTRTAVPHDSVNAAATATIRTYTANPTLGTSVGNIRSQRALFPSSTPGGNISASPTYGFTFGDPSGGQPIVLRGTSQVLAINLNASTITGNSIDGYIEWTEE